jgi:hypothetical protein
MEAREQGTHGSILSPNEGAQPLASTRVRPARDVFGGLATAPTGSRPAARTISSRGPATRRMINPSQGNSTLAVEPRHNPIKIL